MPQSAEKLRKCLLLEKSRKFDNRAVVGGLDKFISIWETEAQVDKLEPDFIQNISARMKIYPQSNQEERPRLLEEMVALLSNLPSELPKNRRSTSTTSGQHDSEEDIPVQPDRSSIPQSTREGYSQHQSRRTSSHASQPNNFGLRAPLTVIPGIGPKIALSMNQLGVNTLEDMLFYFPRRYDDYSKLKPINSIWYGDELTVIGSIQFIETRPIKSGKMTITEAAISDGTGALRLIWFNAGWMTNKFTQGSRVVVAGRVDQYLGRLVMTGAEIELLEQEHLHTNRIVPVYPLTARISQRWLRRTMNQVVTYWSNRLQDFLPPQIREEASLLPISTAILNAHFPDSQEKLEAARGRLAFDEIFLLQLGVLQQKKNWQSDPAKTFPVDENWIHSIFSSLPYVLTSAQIRVLKEIQEDLSRGKAMNRLIQGDVGSGKTIVAAIIAAIIASQGSQTAIMAPTSILAEQHYRNIYRLFTESLSGIPYMIKPDEIRLLIGDTSDEEKTNVRQGLENGTVKLVIGTHAIIEDPVQFQDLQLAVIDEQHRFGVAQRAALRSKGTTPHLLVMTATPIPRSLALSVYGDLDLSVIDQLPTGRLPIETYVLAPLDRERAYRLIRTQVEQGHQAFIIYPLINQSENDEVKAAVEEHARLKREIFQKFEIGLLHGKLPPDEKEEVMTRFRDGQYQILVSTSVVEVGVDVPNATVMLIEGANRFGLAQLHQFRGRVGRGKDQSYCLLIPDREDAVENKRLAVMSETNDGFILAERDLEQRGPGDFLGTRQAGFMELKMASLMDVKLIEKARKFAIQVFEDDPFLEKPENQELRKRFLQFWGDGRGDIS